jgi:hypothetical protein
MTGFVHSASLYRRDAHRPAGICHHLLVIIMVLCASPLIAQNTTPASPISAARDGQVWGALVYASDKQPAEKAEPPAEFPNLAARLAKAFPYKHFQVLGQHSQDIFREYESWVVPSKDLFVKLDSKGAAKHGGIKLNIQFWQGQQVLVKSDTELLPNSPLFIAGPKWRDGRLVFILVLKKVEPSRKAP